MVSRVLSSFLIFLEQWGANKGQNWPKYNSNTKIIKFLDGFVILLASYCPANIENGLSAPEIIPEVTLGHISICLNFIIFQSRCWPANIYSTLLCYYWNKFEFYLIKRNVPVVRLAERRKFWHISFTVPVQTDLRITVCPGWPCKTSENI